MKKKILIILSILVITSLGCLLSYHFYKNSKTVDNSVLMTIKEGTLSNKGATIVLTGLDETKYLVDSNYVIEKKVNNEWVDKVLTVYNDIPLDNKLTLYNNSLELKIDWLDTYGELDKGEYRLKKELTINQIKGKVKKQNIWVYFEL